MKPSWFGQPSGSIFLPSSTYLQNHNPHHHTYCEVMPGGFLDREDEVGHQQQSRANQARDVEPVHNLWYISKS